MSYFSDLFSHYSYAIKESTGIMVRGWVIIPAVFLALYIFTLITGFISQLPLGFAGGLLLGLVHLALITYIYQWLILVSNPRFSMKSDMSEFLQFDSELFMNIINAAFPIFLAEFFISSMVMNIDDLASVPAYLKLAIVFLFNPLPEIIIKDRPYGLSALSDALAFVKNYVVEWFIPLVILSLPTLIFYDFLKSFQLIILELTGSEVLLPIEFIAMFVGKLFAGILALLGLSSSGISTEILAMVVGTGVGCWFGLFRLELYGRLSSRINRFG